MSMIVLGKSGQLASHLRTLLPGAEFWGRDHFDLSDTHRLEAALLDSKATGIINAAAYTAVDRAESEPDIAWRINAEVPAAAARAAAALDVPLIQISTDYVFDGRSPEPYTEDSPVNPLNTYGRTKLAGELAVSSICRRYWILRTSWVFSEYGHNFLKTMIRLAQQQDTLRVVADQFGRPTYAGELAHLIIALMEAVTDRDSLSPGIYHAVGGRVTSWHGFAEEIFVHAYACGLINRRPEVYAISSADHATSAKRPAAAILRPSSALDVLTNAPMDWETYMHHAISTLRSAQT